MRLYSIEVRDTGWSEQPTGALKYLSTPDVSRGTTLRNVEPSCSGLKGQVEVRTLSQPQPQPPPQEKPVKPPPPQSPLQPQPPTTQTLPRYLRDGSVGRGPQSAMQKTLPISQIWRHVCPDWCVHS